MHSLLRRAHAWLRTPQAPLGLVAGLLAGQSSPVPAHGSHMAHALRMPAATTLDSPAAFSFVESSAEFGLDPLDAAEGMGNGLAAADYDQDGFVDLFAPSGPGSPDRLYRNVQGTRFEECGASAGVASTISSRSALWFDADGDHSLDLLVARDAFFVHAPLPDNTLAFYRQNEDHTFESRAEAAGLSGDLIAGPSSHIGGICAADIDRDGHLDFYMTQWQGEAHLFANDGFGAFENITASSGAGGFLNSRWQPLAHDFDGDGWTDLFVAVDFFPNELWMNQRDRTFIDRAADAGLDQAWNQMGATLADVDNDQDFDLYVTNVFENDAGELQHNELHLDMTPAGGVPIGLAGAALGTQQGSLTLAAPDPPIFEEHAQVAGVHGGDWGWGTTTLDANGDGWLDIAATNGSAGVFATDPSHFFLSRCETPPSFSDQSQRVGFDDTFIASTLLAFDVDHDGRSDLLQTCRFDRPGGPSDPLRLLLNRPHPGAGEQNWLLVRPRTSGPNRYAIGAVVRLSRGSMTMTRRISAGTSFLGQEPAEAHFAWPAPSGAASDKDHAGDPISVRVEWPAGGATTLSAVASNQILYVER